MKEHKINAICDERYHNIKQQVDNHEERLTETEKLTAKYFEKVDGVVQSVDGLTETIKWSIGIIVTVAIAIVGFVSKILL
jgi:F0F1-type ATP synthase membrane subunit b/b'